ncbi:MAG: hypothetical protein ACKVQR_07515 [Aquabacterium sp.]
MQHWSATQMHVPILRMIVADVHAGLAPADHSHFRTSRQKRLGRALEEVQAEREREHDLAALRARLAPLRAMLQAQPYVAGAVPAYADYLPFGALQWVTGPATAILPPQNGPVRHNGRNRWPT